MFITSLQPEIPSAIDLSLPTPAHQRKAPRTNESVRGFANSCKFNQVAFLNFSFYPISLSVQSVIDTGEKQKVAAHSRKPNQHVYSVCMGRVPFHVGCLFLYGCLLTRCGCCNQNGCLYSWDAYFVWVLIIPILWYQEYMIL